MLENLLLQLISKQMSIKHINGVEGILFLSI